MRIENMIFIFFIATQAATDICHSVKEGRVSFNLLQKKSTLYLFPEFRNGGDRIGKVPGQSLSFQSFLFSFARNYQRLQKKYLFPNMKNYRNISFCYE